MKENFKSVYLDYAAATPTRLEILKAMNSYWQEVYANPQSVHSSGRKASIAIKEARQKIATVLSVQPSEIVFTSGATEANSLAIIGALRAVKETIINPSVIISEITHGSVRNLQYSHKNEVNTVFAPVDSDGRLECDEIRDLITDQTVLVSCSHANSEIGTLQPVSEIANITKEYRRDNGSKYPLLHVDASQSTLYTSVRPESLGVDLMTLNGQKIYGPKGIGALWVSSGTPLSSLYISHQERQMGDYQVLRPGTPATPLIVGFSEAFLWAQTHWNEHALTVKSLRNYLKNSLEQVFLNISINGSEIYHSPHNLSVTFPDVDHDYLAARLDAYGVAVATTSACQAGKQHGSDVLRRINQNEAIRFSLGVETTKSDLDYVVSTLNKIM
jgi:cysteine desulfurase